MSKQFHRIITQLTESIRLEKDGTTIPVPVEDIRVLLETWSESKEAREVVAEYMDESGSGYLIVNTSEGYQYIWLEPGEPEERGEFYFTQIAAVRAAWQDWDSNGAAPYFFPWGKQLERDAR